MNSPSKTDMATNPLYYSHSAPEAAITRRLVFQKQIKNSKVQACLSLSLSRSCDAAAFGKVLIFNKEATFQNLISSLAVHNPNSQ